MAHPDMVPTSENSPDYGYYENPVVEKTWHRNCSKQQAKSSLYWIFVCAVLLPIVYVDFKFQAISSPLASSGFLIYQSEIVLMLILMVTLVKNLYLYTKHIFSAVVELNPQQKQLLAVRDADASFKITPRPLFSESATASPLFSPSSTSAHSSYSASPGSHSGSRLASPAHISFTPSPYSRSIDGRIANYSLMGNLTLSPDTTPNTSMFLANASQYQSLDTSGLRSRHTVNSPIRTSPVKSTERIMDFMSLDAYLKEESDREYKTCLNSLPDMSTTGNSSFWNYGRQPMDMSHMLRKYQYQLSSRSPQSSTAKNNENDLSTSFRGDEIWHKLGVTEDQLYTWIEKSRKWLCLSIVARLAREIDEINASLRRIGCEDTQIGDVGVSTLKQLALTKGSHMPSLNSAIPYLDFSSNQEYIVKRIKDLGKDGCMSDFDWNGGGDYGKPWSEHLPTDSALVMHLFCTYVDSRLPPQPRFPDGRTFTNQYFLKTPDKPNLTKKDNFCIFQSNINPPHFQVIIEDDVWNLPKGRNSMFQAILLFFYHIKLNEHGMLGRVNLGMSGINILWIFE